MVRAVLIAAAKTMTQPRRIVPGATVLIGRRTDRRHHLFRPDREVNQLFLYALAVSAKRFGVSMHVAVLMANHEHFAATDTRGVLPAFLQYLHRLVALGTKVLRGWEGAVWDHERPSVVDLLTPEAVIDKMAYSLANPVAAGLVRYARDWPGVSIQPNARGDRVLRVARPNFFFDPKNPQWPAEIELELTWPQMLLDAGYTPESIHSAVSAEVVNREATARKELQREGKHFVGADRVARSSPYRRATTAEPLRGLNPTFATGRGHKDAFLEAVSRLRAFRVAYRQALDRWRAGDRTALFPRGTWIMRVLHNACVHDERLDAAAA